MESFMRDLRQNRHRSSRSNAYSQSKCSNWMRFDPYHTEWEILRKERNPTTVFHLGEDLRIEVFQRPLHHAFVRPFTLSDVEQSLREVPEQFLRELGRMMIFGGTKKQAFTARSLQLEGAYFYGGDIGLYPTPEKWMRFRCTHSSPHQLQEYRWSGAEILHQKDGIYVQFDDASLRKYYLQIVLIHEIGHHVDWLRRKKWNRLSEEFARWFSYKYGFECRI